MASLDRHSLARLSLIRYLYLQASAQAEQPHPLSVLSVLQLHDAVEWFLLLASELHDAKTNRQGELMEYWEALEKSSTGQRPGSYQQMKRLSDARRQLKHRGVQPAQSEIADYVRSCESFFNDETPRFFGVSFHEVSLGQLITDAAARERFEQAEQLAAEGNFRDATIEVCRTFHVAHSRRTADLGNSIKLFDMRLFGSMNPFVAQLKDTLEEIVKLMSTMGEQVTRLRIGQDPAAVERFYSISPEFSPAWGLREPTTWLPRDFAPTESDYRFCERFTLTYLLAFQEAI